MVCGRLDKKHRNFLSDLYVLGTLLDANYAMLKCFVTKDGKLGSRDGNLSKLQNCQETLLFNLCLILFGGIE